MIAHRSVEPIRDPKIDPHKHMPNLLLIKDQKKKQINGRWSFFLINHSKGIKHPLSATPRGKKNIYDSNSNAKLYIKFQHGSEN